MKYFAALYMAPPAELEKWAKKPAEERKATEDSLKAQWQAWLAAHTEAVKNTVGLGMAKRVSAAGVTDVQNGLMLSSYVEAESASAAAALFADHPHLKIPGATIEIMETSQLGR